MIKFLIGNMFNAKVTTLVNTVNCVGIMGKGVAQEFKKRYPDMFKDYERRCASHEVKPGVPYLYKDLLGTSIINFPTKDHWRSPSKMDDIIRGLDIIREKLPEWGITSVAFPPLGCGNGGLEWSSVGPLMYQKLKDLDIEIEVYAPFGTPTHQISLAFLDKAPCLDKTQLRGRAQKKLTAELLAILEVLNQLERQPYANPVGRTLFQKICYTLTEQGVDTGFLFKQGSYGPFSSDVNEALSLFANANLLYETQLGRMTAVRTGPEFPKVKERYSEQLRGLQSKILKTVDLFSRIKSTEQAEEVTTVFYSVQQLKRKKPDQHPTERDVYDYVLKWKKHWDSPQKHEAVASAIRNLAILNWIKIAHSNCMPLCEDDF